MHRIFLIAFVLYCFTTGNVSGSDAQDAQVDSRDRYQWTQLMYAAVEGNRGVVNDLLDRGANIEAEDLHGGTALIYAADNGQADVVRLLLSRGADAKKKDHVGKTALMLAAFNGHASVVKTLLPYSDVNAVANNGRTALSHATYEGHLEVISVLIEYGASVDIPENNLQTPLMIAAQNGRIDIARVLMSKGASVTDKNVAGGNALSIAAQTGNKELFELLREKASQPQSIRQFPWPPPRWTSQYAVPPDLIFPSRTETLGSVFDRIKAALRKGEIYEWSIYGIGRDGFAVVAKIEQIQDDGKPKPGNERWQIDTYPRESFTLQAYLRALIIGNPGRYRVIVLLVTSRNLTDGDEPTVEMMARLVKGMQELPGEIREVAVGGALSCYALVYEFRRTAEEHPVVFIESSSLTPINHLVGAGIWKVSELR